MKVVKPQLFNEARVVAEFLKDGITVVVNLEGIEIGEAQRIADFVGGACFAIDGTLKAISNNIFIVARAISRCPEICGMRLSVTVCFLLN